MKERQVPRDKDAVDAGVQDELERLGSLDREFLDKVDRFLEERSLAPPAAAVKPAKEEKRREVGFLWRSFSDEVLAKMTLGFLSALTITFPFLLYYLIGETETPDNRGALTFGGTIFGGLLWNMFLWMPEWHTGFLRDIFRGLRWRHYLKVAKTMPEATLYDIIALNGATIEESYPDLSILRLESNQFIRLKPIYAKIFSGKSNLLIEHIVKYMKNVLKVKESLKDTGLN